MADISVFEFKEAQQTGALFKIIDVREPLEYHTFNVGGTNIPLGKIAFLLANDDLDFNVEDEIIMICQRGLRSQTAKIMLQMAGYKNVKNLIGGLIKLQKI